MNDPTANYMLYICMHDASVSLLWYTDIVHMYMIIIIQGYSHY